MADFAVLALQGDFTAHIRALARVGVIAAPARTAREILGASHLVLPGGESTTMLKLIDAEGLAETLRAFHASGRPMFATCAGVILLAREVRSPAQGSLGLLDVVVERNAYGRQVASFTTPLVCAALGIEPLDAVFIRAPIVRELGASVEVLAEYGSPVLLRDRNVLAATFHPELTTDPRVHAYFAKMAA